MIYTFMKGKSNDTLVVMQPFYTTIAKKKEEEYFQSALSFIWLKFTPSKQAKAYVI